MSLPQAAKPQPTTPPSAASELEFLHGPLPAALARDDFTNLAVLLRHARDGCWAFALYNSVAVREQVVAALKTLVAPLPVYQWTYLPSAPFPYTYLDNLTPEERQARAVVMIFDFERADDTVWKSLDYNRELYSDQPHGLVFWITPPNRGTAARKAPHFWAQRSGVFDFTVSIEEQTRPPRESRWTTSREISIESHDEIQQQLRLYLGLLDELAEAETTPRAYLANLHYKAARLAYYVDDLSLARSQTKTALALAESLNDPTLLADIFHVLGDLALRDAKWKQARQHYNAALALYLTLGTRLGEADALQALGHLAQREADWKQAQQQYDSALAIYLEIKDRLGEANVLQALGDLALHVDDLAGARERYETALTIYPTINDRLGEANVQKALGDLALREDDWTQARQRYEAALALYLMLGDRLGEANVQKALGDLAMREDNLERALPKYETALHIYTSVDDQLGRADTQKALGDLALRKDDLGQARQWYEAAQAIYPQIGASLGEANVLQRLGIIALGQNEHKQAVTFLQKAMASYQASGDRLGEASASVELGRATDDPRFFEQAIRLHEQAQSKFEVARDKYWYGRSQQKLGDQAHAIALLAQARGLLQQLGLDLYAQEVQDELNTLATTVAAENIDPEPTQ